MRLYSTPQNKHSAQECSTNRNENTWNGTKHENINKSHMGLPFYVHPVHITHIL